VSRSDSRAIFSGLDHREEYFPMIARIENKSFFGIPPAPVAPKAATENKAASLAPMINPVTNPASQPPPEVQVVVADDVSLGLFAGDTEDEDEDEDTAVQTPARNTPVNTNTPHRRAHARSSHKRQESRDTDTADPLACHQDEKTWQTWHEQELPEVFSRLIPKRGRRDLVCISSVIYYIVQSLEQY
jgi:hypothetical protein